MRTKHLAVGFLGIVGLFLVTTAMVIVFSLFQFYRFWAQSPGEDVQAVMFEVEDGTSLGDISRDLEEQGFVASDFWFKVYTVISGNAKSIQAGTFEITPGEDYATIADILRDADSDEVTITIPEGYTIAQIGELVVENFDVTESAWSTIVGMESSFESHHFVISAQKPDHVDLEGYLFPDTYRFFADATDEEIVEKLIDTMDQRIDDSVRETEWIPSPVETMHEVLTLASIIQREVGDPDEMAMVADIFLKRLEIGMPLQADSTVNYITGNDTPAISLDDRDIDSLYNTYKYAGLPPGPISNPGLDAITAVLYPTANNYYYFLTTEEGEVIYAVTHDQHVQNKALYLR